jgi:hypothetical protein
MRAASPPLTVPTKADLADFSRDGFLVVRDALPAELVERLLEAGDRLMASPPGPGREDLPQYAIRTCAEPMLREDAFLELLAPPAVLPLVVAILGANISLVGSELIYTDSPGPVRTPEKTLWHRDRMSAARDLGASVPRMALKAAYYLTDALSPDAGMTLFARGSHLLEGPLPIPAGEVDPPEVVRPEVRAGDAVLFEHRTWHCQGFNGSGRVRKAMFVEYGYRWLRRRAREALLPERALERLMEGRDPVVRQLLGDLGTEPDVAHAAGTGSSAIEEWCARHGLPCEPLRDPP